MKQFLKKRWRGVPVGIITAVLAVCLLTGGVFAAYHFLSGTIDVTVGEAITVYYDWPGDSQEWILWTGSPLTITGAYPGESVNIGIRICNASSVTLNVVGTATITAAPSDGWTSITWSGLPNGGIANGSCWEGTVTGTVADDAPTGNYTLSLTFSRS